MSPALVRAWREAGNLASGRGGRKPQEPSCPLAREQPAGMHSGMWNTEAILPVYLLNLQHSRRTTAGETLWRASYLDQPSSVTRPCSQCRRGGNESSLVQPLQDGLCGVPRGWFPIGQLSLEGNSRPRIGASRSRLLKRQPTRLQLDGNLHDVWINPRMVGMIFLGMAIIRKSLNAH